ncbi:hypothetical protein [Paenibacillus sp. P36]|uniref:hypothetical protein n=1 Tax=Paenibacillus sp. P36 TaxID=3342538 RepID=UPI0038B3DB5F
MIALMNNKKLMILIVFVLCAGCFHEQTSTLPTAATQSTKPDKQISGLSVIPGENIQVHDENVHKPNVPTKAITFVNELQGYGITSGKGKASLMQTGDGGTTWKPLRGIDALAAPSMLSFLDSQTGWLLTNESKDQESELSLTADGGQTWEVIAQDLPVLEAEKEIMFFRFFDRQNGLIAVRNGKDLVLLRTQDGGITWLASNRIPMPSEGVVTFLSSSEGWFVGSSSFSSPSEKNKAAVTLYRMTDGESWEEAGKISTSLVPKALSFVDAAHGFVLLQTNQQNRAQGQERQLLRTRDGGKTWSQHTFPAAFQPLDLNLQVSFVTTSNGWLWDARNLWKSKDGGLNWQLLTP